MGTESKAERLRKMRARRLGTHAPDTPPLDREQLWRASAKRLHELGRDEAVLAAYGGDLADAVEDAWERTLPEFKSFLQERERVALASLGRAA